LASPDNQEEEPDQKEANDAPQQNLPEDNPVEPKPGQEGPGVEPAQLDVSDAQKSIEAHLDKLININGNPNRRVSCTEGNKLAVDYITGEFQRLGLVPAG
jgi:hypothetical protein